MHATEPGRLGSGRSARGRYLDSDRVFGELVESLPWPVEAPRVAAHAVRAAGNNTFHHGNRTGPSRAKRTGLTEHEPPD